jgi:uncharacterized Tic20 family protein
VLDEVIQSQSRVGDRQLHCVRALIIVPDGETRFALLTLLTVWCKLAVTDKTECDVFGFFMSVIYRLLSLHIIKVYFVRDDMGGIRRSAGQDS